MPSTGWEPLNEKKKVIKHGNQTISGRAEISEIGKGKIFLIDIKQEVFCHYYQILVKIKTLFPNSLYRE
jgi:hypothetical protein